MLVQELPKHFCWICMVEESKTRQGRDGSSGEKNVKRLSDEIKTPQPIPRWSEEFRAYESKAENWSCYYRCSACAEHPRIYKKYGGRGEISSLLLHDLLVLSKFPDSEAMNSSPPRTYSCFPVLCASQCAGTKRHCQLVYVSLLGCKRSEPIQSK